MHRDTPTHNLTGTELDKPYISRNLIHSEPSLPHTSTPLLLADKQLELTLEESAIKLGKVLQCIKLINLICYSLNSGVFLCDPQIGTNIEGFHIWVGFYVTYKNGSHATGHAYTPLPDRFTDANGQCAHHEVCIILTDHQTAIPVPWRVELCHLKPVPPKKKRWLDCYHFQGSSRCCHRGHCMQDKSLEGRDSHQWGKDSTQLLRHLSSHKTWLVYTPFCQIFHICIFSLHPAYLDCIIYSFS